MNNTSMVRTLINQTSLMTKSSIIRSLLHQFRFTFDSCLPGSNLALGLGCSPLALITSTSRQLLRSQIPSCISPKAGEASAWRPTSCPGPRPSTKLGASPTSGGSRHHLYEENQHKNMSDRF